MVHFLIYAILHIYYHEMLLLACLFSSYSDNCPLVLFCELADGPDAAAYSGKIIECSWNSEDDVWVCMRVRTDKGTPNEFNTYKKVYSVSHYHPIFILILLKKCYQYQIMLFQN